MSQQRRQEMYEFALTGDFDNVKHLYNYDMSKQDKQHMLNTAIMGATPCNDEKPNDGKDNERKQIANWAMCNGACLLWGINQEENNLIDIR